jgi:hypothetical protein
MANLKMKSPSGSTSVSLGGQNYEANEKGVIEIPAEYEDTMYSFGFITIGKNMLEEPETDEPAIPDPVAGPVQEIVPVPAPDSEAAKVEAEPATKQKAK